MDNKDIATLNSTINKIIANIGYKNGTAAPPSQDKLDEELHHLYVINMASSVADKLAKMQKERVLNEVISPLQQADIVETGERSRKDDMKHTANIASGQHYLLHLETRKPADKFNKDKLYTLLQTRFKMKKADADKLFKECTEKAKPAHVYTVVPLTTTE